MMAPGSHLVSAIRQAPLQAMVPQRPTRMRVSLAFVEDRVNVWLRFGEPTVEIVLDRWRRVAMFVPGTVCCRVKWIGNVSGTALWQLLVLLCAHTYLNRYVPEVERARARRHGVDQLADSG